MHLADAFIQSDLQYIQAIHLYCQYVFGICWLQWHMLCKGLHATHVVCP